MISIFLVYGYLGLSYLNSTHHKIQNPVIFIIHTSRGTTTTLHFLLATKEVTDNYDDENNGRGMHRV